MVESATSQNVARASNTLLRRVVLIGTVLSLATADGWMASFERNPRGEMVFHWGWATLVWCLVGTGTSIYFWRKIWPPNDRPPATRGEILIALAVLVLPSLWWLTLPLRFLSGQTLWDVGGGLVVAALVLCFGAWMVTRLIKAFENSDTQDLANEGTTKDGDPASDLAKRGKTDDH